MHVSKPVSYTHLPDHWTVPYLPIDPTDVGRSYDADVIRINSQSGKGGVGYILERNYGIEMPPKMREAMGYAAKAVSDEQNKELQPAEIYQVFEEKFVGITEPYHITVSYTHLDGYKRQVCSSRYGRCDPDCRTGRQYADSSAWTAFFATIGRKRGISE